MWKIYKILKKYKISLYFFYAYANMIMTKNILWGENPMTVEEIIEIVKAFFNAILKILGMEPIE